MLITDPAAGQHDIRLVILSFVAAAVLVMLLRLWTSRLRRSPPPASPQAHPSVAEPAAAHTGTTPGRPSPGRPPPGGTTQPGSGPMRPLQPLVLEVLRQYEQPAAMRLVELQVAVQQALLSVVVPEALREPLAVAIADAIARAPAGCVLVSAERRGDNLEIAVQDDATSPGRQGVDPTLGSARDAMIAMGGSLAVMAHPSGGTRVVLRLPQPQERRAAPPPWVRPPPSDATTDHARTD